MWGGGGEKRDGPPKRFSLIGGRPGGGALAHPASRSCGRKEWAYGIGIRARLERRCPATSLTCPRLSRETPLCFCALRFPRVCVVSWRDLPCIFWLSRIEVGGPSRDAERSACESLCEAQAPAFQSPRASSPRIPPTAVAGPLHRAMQAPSLACAMGRRRQAARSIPPAWGRGWSRAEAARSVGSPPGE